MKFKVTSGNKAANTHEVYRDGRYQEMPGMLLARLTFAAHDDVHPEISAATRLLLEKYQGKSNYITERIMRLSHKLRGTKYHLNNFRKREDEVIKEWNISYNGPSHEYVETDPRLEYEVECFLFQVKSTLDLLAQTIGLIFKQRGVRTYTNNGDELITQLRKSPPKDLNREATILIKILERNKKWIPDAIDMRDDVTHYSDLVGFSCFIRHPWFGEEYAEVSYPSMPNGERARLYMESTWNNLLTLVSDVSECIAAPKPEPE